MKAADRNMQSPLARVRRHGAAGEGTGHFIAQRVSAVALGVLSPWFVVSAALSFRQGSYVEAIDFIAQPVNAVGLILLVAVGMYHMMLGMQEVIVDYIQRPFTKMLLLLLNTLAPLGFAAGAIYAVLAVNFGG